MGNFNLNQLFLFDPLSLFFLAVILVVSLPSAIYSIGYLKGEYTPAKTALCWALLITFVLSMGLVVTVNNAFAFILAWEIMSLVSYFLVAFDTEHEKSVSAGLVYIIMTHIGTACIIAAFFTMFKYADSFSFAAFRGAAVSMPAAVKNTVFLLLLIGFGTKAGIVPLHIWLPYAHPQAPSHISSIMSGVMIKTAIYGMIRFIIFILGPAPAWWGNLILSLAVVSCLAGVMYALMEHDLKRLLAYHSVENIGIILLGVGASMVFVTKGFPVLAVLGLSAGLYHLINHAVFKGLLFLGAGSVYKSCGTRDMEKLGGLIKVMPWTAGAFLTGSMAISALPPLNGFVSEWLTLQAFLAGALNMTGGYKVFLSVCAGALALTGGLAAACFVKAFGITFLALPRSRGASEAKEAALSMKIAMVFLSVLSVILGLSAALAIRVFVRISANVYGINTEAMSFSPNGLIVSIPPVNGAFLSPVYIAAALILIAALITVVMYMSLGKSRVTRGPTWDCGYYKLTPRNEYTATAFSKPFRIAFSFFLLPYSKTEKIRDSFYHVKSFKYEVFTTPIFRRYIYGPLISLIFKAARSLRRIQPGSIHLYITYIFITILLLVIITGWF